MTLTGRVPKVLLRKTLFHYPHPLSMKSEQLAMRADAYAKRYLRTLRLILDPQKFLTAKSKKSKKFLFKLLKT
jgi:hypothetical protein